jgi:hypothetical protein
MDENEAVEDRAPGTAERMPKKVLAAVVALWASAAIMVLATVSTWMMLNARGELGDALYQYPVQSGSGPFLAMFAGLAAAGVRGRTNQGRIAGIVVGIAGTVIALNNMALGIEYTLAIAAYIVVLCTLFTADAKAWCPKPSGTRA